jgi:hypothetical protein
MADLIGINGERVKRLGEAENERFVVERPRSMALLERATRATFEIARHWGEILEAVAKG